METRTRELVKQNTPPLGTRLSTGQAWRGHEMGMQGSSESRNPGTVRAQR